MKFTTEYIALQKPAKKVPNNENESIMSPTKKQEEKTHNQVSLLKPVSAGKAPFNVKSLMLLQNENRTNQGSSCGYHHYEQVSQGTGCIAANRDAKRAGNLIRYKYTQIVRRINRTGWTTKRNKEKKKVIC